MRFALAVLCRLVLLCLVVMYVALKAIHHTTGMFGQFSPRL